jgi:hypothetical protein
LVGSLFELEGAVDPDVLCELGAVAVTGVLLSTDPETLAGSSFVFGFSWLLLVAVEAGGLPSDSELLEVFAE